MKLDNKNVALMFYVIFSIMLIWTFNIVGSIRETALGNSAVSRENNDLIRRNIELIHENKSQSIKLTGYLTEIYNEIQKFDSRLRVVESKATTKKER